MFIFVNIRFGALETLFLEYRLFLQSRICLRNFFINNLVPKMIFARNRREERINRPSYCWKNKQDAELVLYRKKRKIRERKTSATADNEADSGTDRATVYLFLVKNVKYKSWINFLKKRLNPCR